AKAIARGVANDYDLHGRQERQDLEATAYLVLCDYAQKFDPLRSFERSIVAACDDTGDRPAPADGPLVFAGAGLSPWRAAVVSRVADGLGGGAGGAEREQLLRVGRGALARCLARFDATKAFRGWASIEVRARCRREARRICNGGVIGAADPVVVRGLPAA